jgi:hypothetical protein
VGIPEDKPMSQGQLLPHLRATWSQVLAISRELARLSGALLLAFWRQVRPLLRGALQFLLALIIVFEEWGWEPLAELLGRLARWRPWAQLEYAIARLPPYAALFVFVLPTTLLLPLKFLALFLVANGRIVLAGLLFMAAKVVATALVARLFMLTQPALMQIGWFAWGYDALMPWKKRLVDRVHASWAWRVARVWKERARHSAAAAWRRWRPVLLALRASLAPAMSSLRLRARLFMRQIRERWATLQR